MTGSSQADKALAAQQRGVATGARSQLDRHGDGLGHRARNLRTVVRGQLDAHTARLAVAALAAARGARRAARTGEVDLVARAHRLAGLPTQRLEVEELRTGQRRRLLGAYDYQRQLERGYSVTRDASGAVLRSVDGAGTGDDAGHPAGRRDGRARPSPGPTANESHDTTEGTN